LSAAKKEEYEAIRYVRQLLLFLYFTLHLHASFSEGANYSQDPQAPQGLFTDTAQPAPLHFSVRFMQPVACTWRRMPTWGKVATSAFDVEQR